MIGTKGGFPGLAVSLIVAALLGLFIAYPIGSVLVESVVVRGPMSLERLKTVTEEGLAALPPADRQAALARWASAADQRQRVEAMAAAFELTGRAVPWDRKAPFDRQSAAIDAATATLGADERAAVEAVYPTAVAMLHKRTALAFAVREQLGKDAFDRLRNGVETRWGLDHYLKVFRDDYLRQAVLNSLRLAVVAVAFTVTLAFALSLAINSGAVPFPQVVRSVVLLPLVSPPVLIATATVMLFGRRGLVTHSLLDQTLGLIDADATNLYGPVGVVLAQTLSFLPATLIVLDGTLRRRDGRLDDAAAGLGAGRAARFRHVTLPLAWPGLKRAIMLVFILSLTDFGNPAILGQDTPVIAGIIYDEMTAFQNTPLAAALCVWLIAPCLLLYAALDLVGRGKRFSTSGSGAPSELRPSPGARTAAACIAGIVALLILAVYATVALGSVTRVWGVDWSLTLGYFAPAGVDVGYGGSGYGSSNRGLGLVWDSVVVAGIAAPLGGALALVVAYVAERLKPPGANLIAFLALVPAILPGLIFGVGYIVAFAKPFGFKEASLLGTSSILVLNILFGNLFVGVLAARGALQRLDPAVEEAAESLGAGLVRRFAHVTLPMLGTAFLLGTLYVFVDGLTTLSSVIFLVSGSHKLASVAIFNGAGSAEYGYAAAKSVAILGLALLAMVLVWLVERRRGDPVARDGQRGAIAPGLRLDDPIGSP